MGDSIADILKRLRGAAGLDAKTLSRKAHLNETYVRDLEAGRVKSPTVDKLRALADALRVPLSAMLGEPAGLAERQQSIDIPDPDSELLGNFAEVQERVARYLRSTGRRYSQGDIARHSALLWHQIQDLPARMTFAERLDFGMSYFASAHPRAPHAPPLADDKNG